jgi:hypothetical protein
MDWATVQTRTTAKKATLPIVEAEAIRARLDAMGIAQSNY